MVCVVCSCCATSPYREVCRAKGGIGSGATLCHDIYYINHSKNIIDRLIDWLTDWRCWLHRTNVNSVKMNCLRARQCRGSRRPAAFPPTPSPRVPPPDYYWQRSTASSRALDQLVAQSPSNCHPYNNAQQWRSRQRILFHLNLFKVNNKCIRVNTRSPHSPPGAATWWVT